MYAENEEGGLPVLLFFSAKAATFTFVGVGDN
jgi:hypothetical protein